MRLLFVTDFHLRDREGRPEDKSHADVVLRELRGLGAAEPTAACMVIGGDIADAGEPEAYALLKPCLDDLPFPVVPLLGNHDDRAACMAAFGLEGRFAQSRLDLGDVRFLFLDTLDPGLDSGILCDERLNWVAEEIATAEGRPIAVFMHHPPCEIGDAVLDPIRLANAEALAEALCDGNVAQIFFGHVHRTVSTAWNGIPAFGLARPVDDLPVLAVDILDTRLSCCLVGSHR